MLSQILLIRVEIDIWHEELKFFTWNPILLLNLLILFFHLDFHFCLITQFFKNMAYNFAWNAINLIWVKILQSFGRPVFLINRYLSPSCLQLISNNHVDTIWLDSTQGLLLKNLQVSFQLEWDKDCVWIPFWFNMSKFFWYWIHFKIETWLRYTLDFVFEHFLLWDVEITHCSCQVWNWFKFLSFNLSTYKLNTLKIFMNCFILYQNQQFTIWWTCFVVLLILFNPAAKFFVFTWTWQIEVV